MVNTIAKRDLWPKLLISKEHNIRRIVGKQFLYHVRDINFGTKTLCGITLKRRISFMDAYEAKGAALLCSNCRRRSFGEKGKPKSLLPM